MKLLYAITLLFLAACTHADAAVVSDIDYSVNVSESTSAAENQAGAIQHLLEGSIDLGDGTGALQADMIFSDRRSLAASGSEVIDLAGVLTGALGDTLTFVEVVYVGIRNRNTTDGDDLNAGPDATAGWLGPWVDASDRSLIPAGGLFQWYDPNGQTVGAGATDEIYIVEVGGANTVTFDLVVIGRSA